jgi:hypothetical protein
VRAVAERSTLPKDEARRRYVALAQRQVLEQIKRDSELLDEQAIPIGPFARLDANDVAAHDGKTRGAITNLFGSQAAFQAATMALVLSVGDWIELLEYPMPEDFGTADEWLDALFGFESERGPQHGGKPVVDYWSLWALWLSTVPYGIWSEHVQGPSMDEHAQWVGRLERELGHALAVFGLELREGTTINDLAGGIASLIEGVWLNQCLTTRHPTRPSEPIVEMLRRSGKLLWLGATCHDRTA